MIPEKIIKKIGDICSWLSFILVILISLDVFLRYVFNFSSASLYELEWHMFAVIFMVGSSLTLLTRQSSYLRNLQGVERLYPLILTININFSL